MERTLLDIQCPECTGPLWEERQGRIVQYRCRVGHAYSPLSLKEEHRDAIEKSLWSCVITLENAAAALERLSSELGPQALEDARLKREQAKALKDFIAQMGS